jgi:hypothetical protein
MGSVEEITWVSLPFSGELLESVVHFGNGKDAELELMFADGRRAVLAAKAVRLQVSGGVVVEVSSWDDVSLRTVYRAPGLTLHSGRIGFPAWDDDEPALFRAGVGSWLAAGCDKELLWTVHVQVSLTSSPTNSLIPPDDATTA